MTSFQIPYDLYDVMINVHKGQSGYGIYFAQKESGDIVVTKIDQKSEADSAGVQPQDKLISVKDLDGVYPDEKMAVKAHDPSAGIVAPGEEVFVSKDNYHQALDMVRQMKYCQFKLLSKSLQDASNGKGPPCVF